MAGSPFSTPKRKHSELLSDEFPYLENTSQFTFDPHSPVKDGSASPRTSVARRFQGLALESGGGVDESGGHRTSPSSHSKPTGHVFVSMEDSDHDGARKRVKLPELASDTSDLQLPAASWDDPVMQTTSDVKPTQQPQATPKKKTGSQSPRQHSPRAVRFALDTAAVEQADTVAKTEHDTIRTASPSPRASPKPRNARAGTPPFVFKGTIPTVNRPAGAKNQTETVGEVFVTDPLRASLTWHDDEITIYDPDDSDDDGTGINGIGFKPTPAIAYARTVKRKQQLAEYRKREEREARAKRSQRRRGSPATTLVEHKDVMERRRVRFMESATQLMSF